MIPRKLEPVVFGFVLSGLMSLILSAVSTFMAGTGDGFAVLLARSWLAGWLVAFPVVLVAGPLARRMVQALLRPA
jgi:hypothetical protein